MSNILKNMNKEISLLNNSEINSVIQMIKNRRTELSRDAGSNLSVGQAVTFKHRSGNTVRSVITKINLKTALLRDTDNKRWKVSLALLEAA
jgi:hypothetical protein